MKNIAIVAQRFGRDITGGAEAHAYQIARMLSSELGYKVSIYTTTAVDYRNWKNQLPAGESDDDGLKIIRFRSLLPRLEIMQKLILKFARGLNKLGFPSWLIAPVEKFWFIAQGPYSPALHRALKTNAANYDKIIFFTYLYYPTAAAPLKLIERALLIPTAHDESPFYLKQIGTILNSFEAILPNTAPEAALIRRVHQVKSPLTPVGLGFSSGEFVERTNDENLGNYIAYLGRICRGKSVHVLVESFVKYKQSNPSDLKLILCGHNEGDCKIPIRDDIHLMGFVDERTKWNLLRQAKALVNPSRHESLSMIVLEAIESLCPVLLNGDCEVFQYYAKTIDGVKLFAPRQLEEELTKLLASEKNTVELASAQSWVRNNYAWDVVIEKYRAAIEQ